MRLAKISQILLCASVLALTGCAQKANNNLSSSQKQVIANSWQWDDQKKQWFYNGSEFEAEASSRSALWKHQKQAISLNIESGKSLNAFDNAPSGLLMKVFQLSDPKAFLKAAESSVGLKNLLTSEKVDPAYISSERLIILPGNPKKLTLDRIEGARYIGIVLAYSNLEQAQIFRLVPIVTIKNNTAKPENQAEPSLFSSFWKAVNSKKHAEAVEIDSHPALLELQLSLGANGISSLDIKAK